LSRSVCLSCSKQEGTNSTSKRNADLEAEEETESAPAKRAKAK
jgi:hypothetical protein